MTGKHPIVFGPRTLCSPIDQELTSLIRSTIRLNSRRRLALLIVIGITILVFLLRYRRELAEWFETHEHLLD